MWRMEIINLIILAHFKWNSGKENVIKLVHNGIYKLILLQKFIKNTFRVISIFLILLGGVQPSRKQLFYIPAYKIRKTN